MTTQSGLGELWVRLYGCLCEIDFEGQKHKRNRTEVNGEHKMKIAFLGTGNAWGFPNELCECAICKAAIASKDSRDKRLRTSLYIEASSKRILVDCGPDFGQQRKKYGIKSIDILLITHPHPDHIGGLDDLVPYQRATKEETWMPIPTYAHEHAWGEIKEKRSLGYLVGTKEQKKVLEERVAESGQKIEGFEGIVITPFKTYHGKFAPGSIGYVIDAENTKVVYTSDFGYLESDDSGLMNPDVLIIEANWYNEPLNNRWGHMSFQRAIYYIKRWQPTKAVYFVHFSDEDQVPDDPMNALPTKWVPQNPLKYDVPKTHQEWDDTVRRIFKDERLPCSQQSVKAYPCDNILNQYDGFVAFDGLIVEL